MRFTGTHIPGDHRLVTPAPAQVVIPERKIVSAEEAAKWHASRGGAAAEEEEDGGGGGILLPGLVGWALTSGPEQTLSSAGVIASGPLDWTASGSPSYSSAGVALGGDGKRLSVTGIDFEDPFVITYQFLPGSQNENDVFYHVTRSIEVPFSEQFVSHVAINAGPDPSAHAEIEITDDVDYAGASSELFNRALLANRQFIACYFDGASYSIQRNDGSLVGTYGDLLPMVYDPSVPTYLGYWFGYGNNQQVRNLRMWQGVNLSAVLASLDWQANMSGGVSLGRTDAEIPDYAG